MSALSAQIGHTLLDFQSCPAMYTWGRRSKGLVCLYSTTFLCLHLSNMPFKNTNYFQGKQWWVFRLNLRLLNRLNKSTQMYFSYQNLILNLFSSQRKVGVICIIFLCLQIEFQQLYFLLPEGILNYYIIEQTGLIKNMAPLRSNDAYHNRSCIGLSTVFLFSKVYNMLYLPRWLSNDGLPFVYKL